jgi:hypothetical protein
MSGMIDHDYQLRPPFKTYLRGLEWNVPIRFADEVRIGDARIDLAVITDALHGYEIKAELDSMTRFKTQAACYETTFDYCTLVTTEKKGERVRRSLPDFWGLKVRRSLPDFWGLTCAFEQNGTVQFWEVRAPKLNPHRQLKGLLGLLWRDECREFLASRNAAKSRHRSKDKMTAVMAMLADEGELLAYVCQCLKARQEWRHEDGTVIPIPGMERAKETPEDRQQNRKSRSFLREFEVMKAAGATPGEMKARFALK